MFAHRLSLTVVVALLLLVLATPAPAYAYVGPGPGLEMLPNFFGLLAWVGLAVAAMLAWPLTAMARWLWRSVAA